MWSNGSCSPIELRPAAPWPLALGAVLALAAAGLALLLGGVPADVALGTLVLPAVAWARALRRHRSLGTLRSPVPGRWLLELADGRSRGARVLQAWAVGPWLAALAIDVPGRGRYGVTLLARDHPPDDWRRLLVRLRIPSGS
jgi:hypothetical protein